MKQQLLEVWIVNILVFTGIRAIAPEQLTYGFIGVMGQFIVILAHHSYYASQKKVRDVNYSFYLVTPLLAFFLGLLIAPKLGEKLTIFHADIWALILGGLAEYTSEFLNIAVKTIKSIIPFLLNKLAGKKDE